MTNCHGLKTIATVRMPDVAHAEQCLRLMQSVPSPKAEPFKRWLAKVGDARLEGPTALSESHAARRLVEQHPGEPAPCLSQPQHSR